MSKFLSIKSFPFFYGYVIIFAGTIGIIMSAPGQTVGVSVFTDFLIDELDISRENLSLAYMIGTLASSLILTYAGKFFDKYGARLTSILSGIMLGLALYYLSEISSMNGFLIQVFNISNSSAVIFTLLVFGFFAIRFSGQGVLTMTSRNMVMKWFEKKRGMASAVMGIAISFGFSYSPKVFDYIISLSNWQTAWQYIAIAVGVCFTIFAFIFFRDNPKEYGLLPDGKHAVKEKKNAPKYNPDKDFTLKEARSTYRFWIFNLTLTLHGLYITALTFHIVDIFAAAGLTRDEAINTFLPSAVIAVVFQISAGYLADFIKMKYLLMVELSGLCVAMLGLSILGEGLPYYLIIIGNGIGSGLFGIVSSVSWPRYFGTKNLGAISGFNMSWVVAGSAVGPYLFSVLNDLLGDYTSSGVLMLAMGLVLLLLAIKADNTNLKEDRLGKIGS